MTLTTSSILVVFFIIELAIVASGVSIYLFFQVKRFKKKLDMRRHGENGELEAAPTLHDLFDSQILRTRKRISEPLPNISSEEKKRQHSLLSQRIEFLKIEKEVLNEHATDHSYWNKLCGRLASVNAKYHADIHGQQDVSPQAAASIAAEIDNSADKQRIADYQQQLNDLREEFNSYRKYSNKMAASLAEQNSGKTKDKAINDVIEEFNQHDRQLRAHLAEIEKKNDALKRKLDDVECDNFIQQQKAQHGQLELNAKTASDEEVKRLRAVIKRQYESIDELRAAAALAGGAGKAGDSAGKLAAAEKTQQDLSSRIEVLESEKQRLTQELASKRTETKVVEVQSAPPKELFELRLENKELNDEVRKLNTELRKKDEAIGELKDEYDNLQKEFMQMYTEQGS